MRHDNVEHVPSGKWVLVLMALQDLEALGNVDYDPFIAGVRDKLRMAVQEEDRRGRLMVTSGQVLDRDLMHFEGA